jgi:hypothetical protein
MTLRTPTLPEAVLVSTFTLAVVATALTWTTLNSRRFVQLAGMRETILDSRTGCIWRMGITPPKKSCPGDKSNEPTASTAPPPAADFDEFMQREAAKAPSGTASVSDITPDAFMAEVRRRPAPDTTTPMAARTPGSRPNQEHHVNAPALAQEITKMVLSLALGVAALWWAFRRVKHRRSQ